jgi:hypothetical protein
LIDHKPLSAADRAFLKANLVRLADIARRTERTATTVNSWTKRYSDWPEPVVPAPDGKPGGLYWWPEVAAFLKERSLPGKSRPGQAYTHVFGRPIDPVSGETIETGY